MGDRVLPRAGRKGKAGSGKPIFMTPSVDITARGPGPTTAKARWASSDILVSIASRRLLLINCIDRLTSIAADAHTASQCDNRMD